MSTVKSQKGKALARLHEATANIHLANRESVRKLDESYRLEYTVHRSVFSFELSELFLALKANQKKTESLDVSVTEKSAARQLAQSEYDVEVEKIIKTYRADLEKRAEAFRALKVSIGEKLAVEILRYQNIYLEEFYL